MAEGDVKLLKLLDGTDTFRSKEGRTFSRGGAPVAVSPAEAEYLLTFPYHVFVEVAATPEALAEAQAALDRQAEVAAAIAAVNASQQDVDVTTMPQDLSKANYTG